MPLKTFADVKRRMVPGLKLTAVNHIRPAASGPRVVTRVQTNGYYFKLEPRDGLPGDTREAWFQYPPAKHVRIDGPNVVTFLFEGRDGVVPGVTLTFPAE